LRERRVENLAEHFVISYLIKVLGMSSFSVNIRLPLIFNRDLKFCSRLSNERALQYLKKRIEPSVNQLKEMLRMGALEGKTKYFKFKAERIKEGRGEHTIEMPFPYNFPEIRVRDKIEESVSHLPSTSPGIVIIEHSHYSIDEETIQAIRDFLEVREFESLVGVVLVKYSYSLDGIKGKKVVIPLKHSKFWSSSAQKVLSVLEDKL